MTAFHPLLRTLGLCVLVTGLIAGCGGGSKNSDSGAEGGTAPAQTGPVTVTLDATTLTGVAATGAPLLGATVRLKDANGSSVALLDALGRTVFEARTSAADGSFRLTLADATQRLPLMLQVAGLDAAGNPVALHSALSTATQPLVAHVTPLTDAVLALVLGTDPRTIWADAQNQASVLGSLGHVPAMTAASTLLKGVIKSNLTAAKITDSTTLDLFRDATFTASKTGLDLALEELRVRLVRTTQGVEQLQFSNKLASLVAPEVAVALATARTELLKTGGVPANAIGSTLKATTSPTGLATALATLDSVGVTLNGLIAQGTSAAGFGSASLLSGPTGYTYTQYNGRSRAQLQSKLETYAQNNWQLGRLMVTGCADDPLPSKGCARYAVAAPVLDTVGQMREVFQEVVATKPASQGVPAQWYLVGNGLQADFQVRAAAYAEYGSDGRLLASSSTQANPRSGVVVDFSGTGIQNTYIQTPANFSLRYSTCGQSYLCYTASSTEAASFTGGIRDTMFEQASLGWVGSRDTLAGAKYIATYGSPQVTQTAYLAVDVPAGLQQMAWPTLDVMPPTLTGRSFQSNVALGWSIWALANPQMRLREVRLIAKQTASQTVSLVARQAALGAVSMTFPGQGEPADATTYQLLLVAQDAQGRQIYSLLNLPD